VAVERVFADVNVATVMTTAHATAVAMLVGGQARPPGRLAHPDRGQGRRHRLRSRGKAQVTTMVTRLLGLEVAPRPADAADALAFAICHVWRSGTRPGSTPSRQRRAPMIASLAGTVTHVGLDHVVVEVGGVGMLVHTTPTTAADAASGAELPRDDARRARGLVDPLRLRRARRSATCSSVQTVSGVGPRLALAMLSVMARASCAAAWPSGDSKALTSRSPASA
jgi:hypothetical protein